MYILWARVRRANICVIGVPERPENMRGIESLSKEAVKIPQLRQEYKYSGKVQMSLVRSSKQTHFKTFCNQALKAVRFSREQEKNTQKVSQFSWQQASQKHYRLEENNMGFSNYWRKKKDYVSSRNTISTKSINGK